MSTPERRGRGVAAGLTPETVVGAAERVVERLGVERTSLRAVAVELGVTPGALYNHFSSKQHMLDAVADEFVAREVLRGIPARFQPLDRIRLVCRRLHAAGTVHPMLLSAVIGHVPDLVNSAQMAVAEVLLTSLKDAGVAPERRSALYRALVTLSLGNAIYDANLAKLSPTKLERALARHIEQSPHEELVRYMKELPRPSDRGWFDLQLDLLLETVEPATTKGLQA